MNKNSHIEKYLENYLLLDKPEFAVLLSGKWGSGKTYFIDKFIENHKKEEEIKFIKISLFGLKEVDSIDEQIFQNLHPFMGNKYVKLTGNIAKNALKFGIKLDWKDDAKSDGTSNIDLSKFNPLDFFSDEKKSKIKIIFVFDDLERTDIDLIEVLGYINYLVEESEFNVIILANEEKLKDKEKNDNLNNYLEFKEKVIGKTFEVQHDLYNIFSSLIKDKKEETHLLENKKNIVSIFKQIGNENLRILNQVFNDFEYFIDNIDKKFLKNEKFIEQLVKEFFRFALFIKVSNPNKNEFIEELSKTKNNLFTNNKWVEIFFDNNFTDITKLISDLYYFIEKKEQLLWIQLFHYDSLEDDEFNRLMKEMINKFNSCHYMNDPSELVSVIDILLYFSKHELSKLTDVEIKNKVEECIRKKNLKWNKYLANNDYIKRNGLGYKSKDNEKFIKIKDMIIDKFENAKKTYNENLSNQKCIKDKAIVKKAIEDNDNILFTLFNDEYQNKNLFELISVDDLIDSIKSSKNENTNNNYLHFRYISHKNISLLKVELKYWKEVYEKLSDYCKNTKKTLKTHLIEKFNDDTIEKIIRILEKSTNE